MNARILDITSDQYHADADSAVPRLSQSIATTLITRSPAHAYLEHPRLGGEARSPSTAMDDGTIIHALVLGAGLDGIEVITGFDDWRRKAAQELRDAAREAGKTPVLERRYAELEAAAQRIRANIASFGIEFNGRSEVAIEWLEPGDVGDVVCRGMIDHLVLERGTIIDLKTIRSADLRTCSRHAVELGYDIQAAAYTSAVGKLRPDLAGRVDYLWIFAELEPPYAVVPARPDGMLRELGARRWSRAVRIWERCLLSDTWPAYVDRIATLEAPAWALIEEEHHAEA